MTEHRTALICTDVQNDFIDGALGGRTEDEIELRRAVIAPLLALAESADLVIASRCWHPPDHCSFSATPKYEHLSWPAHGVKQTLGALIVMPIMLVADYIINKGTERDTEALSAFEGTLVGSHQRPDLAWLLRQEKITRVKVGGLLIEFCVKATALSSRHHGFETIVDLGACCGLEEETTAQAMEEMLAAGVRFQL